MRILAPSAGSAYHIAPDATWPSVEFVTDGSGPHTWHWTVVWGRFQASGSETTSGNRWDVRSAITDRGGTLTVRAEAAALGQRQSVAGIPRLSTAIPRVSTAIPAPTGPMFSAAPSAASGGASAAVTIEVFGTNPTKADVLHLLTGKAGSAGFDRILDHESHFVHFKLGRPIRSFDGGYGMCQLTTPVPTFEQVWNWKRNVEAGLALFEQKRHAAIRYLGQAGRTYTARQLLYEAVSRWNGGHYHVWDASAAAWVRASTIVCDSKTGNIGWDMTDPQNRGRTETELHQRDSASYRKGRAAGAHWRYFGVCYADSLLGGR